ncbi:MAG: 2-amino-4-hydroxy-6-hydroxymethyldihydropteridine diphosphokinase [Planctomycetes bacterium]|nr:2-amino-4-hydroxy-6-hydroxymethyldihydropteridine diphosphokinase [Planctomycetota bacterium]
MRGTTAYIGLGSNLGDRRGMIGQALSLLKACPEVELSGVSHLMTTAAVGGPRDQGDFLNAVARITCRLSAEDLLKRLLEIEDRLGRKRVEKWGPRTIDLDILLFGDRIIDQEELKVPHPLMSSRSFVMTPMVELAGDMVHPQLGKTMREILNLLEGE